MLKLHWHDEPVEFILVMQLFAVASGGEQLGGPRVSAALFVSSLVRL